MSDRQSKKINKTKNPPCYACSGNKPLFVIANIETGVRKHWEIYRLQSSWCRFVNIDHFITIMSTHNHLISDVSGDWSKRPYSLNDKCGKAMLPV